MTKEEVSSLIQSNSSKMEKYLNDLSEKISKDDTIVSMFGNLQESTQNLDDENEIIRLMDDLYQRFAQYVNIQYNISSSMATMFMADITKIPSMTYDIGRDYLEFIFQINKTGNEHVGIVIQKILTKHLEKIHKEKYNE